MLSISWWDLDGSPQTVTSLREYLRDGGVAPWREVPGLVAKVWFSDPDAQLWGALMLWEHAPPPAEDLPPHVAADLIGYPPTGRRRLAVEATAVGRCEEIPLAALQGLGLALSGEPARS